MFRRFYQQVTRPSVNRNPAELWAAGSPVYEWTNTAALAAGSITWLSVKTSFPKAAIYEPLDSITITNNSAQAVSILLNGNEETITVPAYMIKPINRRAFSYFGIRNNGAAAIAIGEIIIQVKRLPPDIQPVANVGG
jgi:hypothetical protein